MATGVMLSTALHLATSAHHGQYDKGGQPYILHCLTVMSFLDDKDEELQCIALLHDVIEDTETTYAELRAKGISERVIKGVQCLTKVNGETFDEYKDKVLSNRDSMLVKKADLRHNTDIRRLKGITEKDMARTSRYYAFYTEIDSKLNGSDTSK